jgi:hypothetical protein
MAGLLVPQKFAPIELVIRMPVLVLRCVLPMAEASVAVIQVVKNVPLVKQSYVLLMEEENAVSMKVV